MLPSWFTLHTVPQPLNVALRVRQLDEPWVSVRASVGRSTESNRRDNAIGLQRLLQVAKATPTGSPSFAVYNGPYTPWSIRLNEVMVPVAAPRR